jgi:hypothetical protein
MEHRTNADIQAELMASHRRLMSNLARTPPLFGPKDPKMAALAEKLAEMPPPVQADTFISALPPPPPPRLVAPQDPQAYLVSSIPGLLFNDQLVFAHPRSPLLETCSHPVRAPSLDGLYRPLDTPAEKIEAIQNMLFPITVAAAPFTIISPTVAASLGTYEAISKSADVWAAVDRKANGRDYILLSPSEFADVGAELSVKWLVEDIVGNKVGSYFPALPRRGRRAMLNPFSEPASALGSAFFSEFVMPEWETIKTELPLFSAEFLQELGNGDNLFSPGDITPATDAERAAFKQQLDNISSGAGNIARDFIWQLGTSDNLLPSAAELDALNGEAPLPTIGIPEANTLTPDTQAQQLPNVIFPNPLANPNLNLTPSQAHNFGPVPQLYTPPDTKKIGVSGFIGTDEHGNVRWQVSTSDPYIGAGLALINPVGNELSYRWQQLHANNTTAPGIELARRLSQLKDLQGDFSALSIKNWGHLDKLIFKPSKLKARRREQVKNAYQEYASAHPSDTKMGVEAKMIAFVHDNGQPSLIDHIEGNIGKIAELYYAEVNQQLENFNNAAKKNNPGSLDTAANKLLEMAPHLVASHEAKAHAMEANKNPKAAKPHYDKACQIATEDVAECKKQADANWQPWAVQSNEQAAKGQAALDAWQQAQSKQLDVEKQRLAHLKRQALNDANKQKAQDTASFKAKAEALARQHPHDHSLKERCADACLLSDDLKGAIECQAAACQNNSNPNAHRKLSDLYKSANDDRWASALKKYADLSKDSETTKQLVNHFMDQEDWQQARPLLQRLHKENDADDAVNRNLLYCHTKLGDKAAIEKDMLPKYQDPNSSHEFKSALANYYYTEGDWKTATPLLQSLDTSTPYKTNGAPNPEKLKLQQQLLYALGEQGHFDETAGYLAAERQNPDCSQEIKEWNGQVKQKHFDEGMNKAVVATSVVVGSHSVGGWLGTKMGGALAWAGLFGEPGTPPDARKNIPTTSVEYK